MNTTLNPQEVEKFSRIASEWWNPHGKFKPLHRFNPIRIGYIRQQVTGHFGLNDTQRQPFTGLSFLDIGCGGGLLSEPMTRLGAKVTGVDASEKNINTASVHAVQGGLEIDYRASTAEALAQAGEKFDVILNMEVIEHVADPQLFLQSCCQMLKPNGMMVVATLNRTLSSFFKAIVGAEYVLRWLPVGTHDWKKFLKPDEILNLLSSEDVMLTDTSGFSYDPLSGAWSMSYDNRVNYVMTFVKKSDDNVTVVTHDE